jgi:hypothetical protein
LTVEEFKDDLLVQFNGAVTTPQYKVNKVDFHWDFAKVFMALAIPRLVLQGVVPLHAAVVVSKAGAVLLPGLSGAGKSSIAFAAFQQGLSTPASELSFIRDGVLIAGNSVMTIDVGALERYGTQIPASATEIDGRVFLPSGYQSGPVRLSRVLFPRVCPTPLAVRTITTLRARMLMFENAITELPVANQVAHQTCPIGISPTKLELDIVSQQVELLARLSPAIVEGSPADVLTYISSLDGG